jgi:RNA-directed DNA polymerase
MEASGASQPPPVTETGKRGGFDPVRWCWTEPSVWTERMLMALEEGVKGGVWFSLMDKVFSERNLLASAAKVVSNGGAAGVDHVSTEEFERHRESNVSGLSQALREGSYEPSMIRRVEIPKPGSAERRPLGIPTVRDRVVQGALRQVLEPIFEREFAERSYGFRPGQGCKDALRVVDDLLKDGCHYVVDVDLKSFFDTISHDRLMGRLRERIADGRVLALVESFLKAGITSGLEEWEPEAGAPQGAVLSPLLSNICLNPLDHLAVVRGWEMVRYADDFVILCRSRAEAEQVLTTVCQWCEAEGLTVHPTKSRIVDARVEGFDFLGYHFGMRHGRWSRWPRTKSLAKLKDSIRSETKRTNGSSLEVVILRVNRTLRGWYAYFRHSHWWTFGTLDGWIRMRLRSLLRRRAGREGCGVGPDHRTWPNSYFSERGLFILKAAHAAESIP